MTNEEEREAYEIYEGDCLRLMESLPSFSVDMVLCDLPYGTTNCRWDTPLNLEKLWLQYNRICTGVVVLFAQTPFDKVLGVSNLGKLRYEWIWEKSSSTGHLNAKKSPMKSHENILVFGGKKYNPQMTHGHKRKSAVKRGDTTPIYGIQKLDGISYDSTSRYPRSVLKFPSDKQRSKLHPTQKPLALCEYLIRTYTHPNDVVLDNCMGSGTTGLAAINQGRKFVGIELDPHYFTVAKERISNGKQ